jgi:glycosyltransferase involved in cell wall biosynthesis
MMKSDVVNDGLVSVIIPCYNSRNTILNCLKSVIDQSYQNLEFVLVDDGSSDDTVQILERFKNQYKSEYSIKILEQPNAGPSKARNYGVERASGSLIAFLDSDDVWLPHKLQVQVDVFNNLPISPVMIGARFPFKQSQSKIAGFKKITIRDLLWRNYFQTSSVLIPINILKANKFNECQKYSEDYDLWMRLATQGNCILLNGFVTRASERAFAGDGLSSNFWEMEKGELSVYIRLFKNGIIKRYEYYFFSVYSIFKYLRRCFLSRR